MAARFAAKGDELAKVVRQTQDLATQLAQADKSLIEEVGQPRDRINSSKITALRRTGENPRDGQAHPEQIWLPPGLAGRGGEDRPDAGRVALGNVGDRVSMDRRDRNTGWLILPT